MNRRSKFLLGTIIAIATAGTLYATVGKRFHEHRYAMHKEWRHHHYCNDGDFDKKNQPATDSTKWK